MIVCDGSADAKLVTHPQAKWVPRGIEIDAHLFLRLIVRKGCAGGDRMGASGVEVLDLDVQVNHHLLITGPGGPGRPESLGIGSDAVPAEAQSMAVRAAVDNLGNLVDSFHHQLPGVATVHERIFAQYADRCQLDLVLLPAAIPSGSVPGAVVPYDQDHQLTALPAPPVSLGSPRPPP